MAATFGDFMLGLTLVVAQSALFGMLAFWLGLRRSRPARMTAGFAVLSMVWIDLVPVINRLGGYPAQSDLDSCLSSIFALVVGWIAGRNRRLRAIMSQVDYSGRSRLLFDKAVRVIGTWISVLSGLYGALAGLFGFVVVLSIVSNMLGFWGSVAGFILAPVTFLIMPLFVGFRSHNWLPAAFCYGGSAAALLGLAFGWLVAEQDLAA